MFAEVSRSAMDSGWTYLGLNTWDYSTTYRRGAWELKVTFSPNLSQIRQVRLNGALVAPNLAMVRERLARG